MNRHQMYRRAQQEAAAEAAAQPAVMDCEEAGPQSVPEILYTTGGFAVVVRDRIVEDLPFSDVWGDAR